MKRIIWIVVIVFTSIHIYSQDQVKADSFKLLIDNYDQIDSVYLDLLGTVAVNETDPVISEEFSDVLIRKATEIENDLYLFRGYLFKGNADNRQGNLEEALESYFDAVPIAIRLKRSDFEGQVYGSIADTYSISEDYQKAVEYYNRSIATLRETSDSVSLATAILNAGDTYFYQEKYDSALVYFKESGEIFESVGIPVGLAYNYGNMGMVYASQGKHQLAESNLTVGIEILQELEDYYPISVYMTYMSDIYHDRNDHPKALDYAHRSLEMAQKYDLKDQISDANLKLYELHEHVGEYQEALVHFIDYKTYQDSVINMESVRSLANQEADFEVSLKQAEVDLLEQTKKTQRITIIGTLITLGLIGVMAIFLFRRNRYIKKTNAIIAAEKEKSDNLLLNILPEETADELKEHGKVAAQKYDSVTVLFTDFKGFTRFSENLDPTDLVKSVDYYFSKFDEIMDRYDIEKIKTIGDAYMCAAGLPYPSDDHPEKCILAAKDIIQVMHDIKAQTPEGVTPLDIRIGINTGPVVAGVVGTKKFAYDIWGDTVNVALRMESNAEVGQINLSESTYNLVKDKFDCTYRGEYEVKNRGTMKMYYVN